MSNFAVIYEDPEYTIDSAEWDQAFPQEQTDWLQHYEVVNFQTARPDCREDFSPYNTVNS